MSALFSTKRSYHEDLVADLFREPLSDEAAMLVMTLLHSYSIVLPGPVFKDSEYVGTMAPVTQRHAAQCVARIWRVTTDPRSKYMHWYAKWQDWGAYSRLERLSDSDRQQLARLKAQFETHAAVDHLLPDDFDLLNPATTTDSRDAIFDVS